MSSVYDPFVGSGTTIIAAEMTGRACHAIEIDPAYVDVAVTRWEDFTWAVLRLITSSNLEGNCTGNSLTLACVAARGGDPSASLHIAELTPTLG